MNCVFCFFVYMFFVVENWTVYFSLTESALLFVLFSSSYNLDLSSNQGQYSDKTSVFFSLFCTVP